MSAHTPGPFEARDKTVYAPNAKGISVAFCGDGMIHTRTGSYRIEPDEARANAALIAAAPDLLAALKSAHAALGHVVSAFGIEPLCPEGCDIAAAISKAEGRS